MLAEEGREVTVLEMLEGWGHGMPPDARWHMQRHFTHLPVDFQLKTKVLRVAGTTVFAEHEGAPVTFTGIDTVVVCAGARPNQTLIEAVRSVVKSVEVIGDAVRPRSGLEAVAEGYRAARLIGGTAAVPDPVGVAH
jgi:pyruvate/2-oxoglutarate dehydrogenase complex dihydrolipoamide dehydrogenase (E3) component